MWPALACIAVIPLQLYYTVDEKISVATAKSFSCCPNVKGDGIRLMVLFPSSVTLTH